MDSEMEIDYAADLSDVVSLAPSTESQREKEYEVETILADRYTGKLEYLVKWAGYHTLRASWEPARNFNSPDTIRQWKAKKLRIEKGELPRFDVEKWETSVAKGEALHEAHEVEREAQKRLTQERLEHLLFQDDLNIDQGPPDDLVDSPVEPAVPSAVIAEERLNRDSPLFVSAEDTPALTPIGESALNTEATGKTPSTEPTSQPPQSSTQASTLSHTQPSTSHCPPVPDKPPRSPPLPLVSRGPPKNKPTSTKPLPLKSPTDSAISNFTAPQTARKSKWDVRSREAAPDANQLTLLKPSEFPARFGDSHAMTSSTDDLPSHTDKTLSQAVEPTHPAIPLAMAPPQRPPKPRAQERPRSPGPYSRRDSSRFSDNTRSEAHRRPRSPGPYGRRELTTRDEDERFGTLRQSDFYRSREYTRDAGYCRPSSPGKVSPRPAPPVPSSGDSYRPRPIPNVPSSKITTRNPDRRVLPASTAPVISQEQKAITVVDQIARMPVGKFVPGGVKTSNGYFFNPGEALAHIFFGPERKPVGAVRICGMNPKAKADMLASKEKRGTHFEMTFHLCTLEDYRYICEQGSQQGFNNLMWCKAWMEGFEDTNAKLFHMADYLRENNLLAIYYPADHRGNVWLAYSPKCPDFDFLEYDHLAVPDGVPIRLAVRSPLLPLDILNARPPALTLEDSTVFNDSSMQPPLGLPTPQTPSLPISMASAADPRLRRRGSTGANLSQAPDQGMSLVRTHEQPGVSSPFNNSGVDLPVIRRDSLPNIPDMAGPMDTPGSGSPPTGVINPPPDDSRTSLRWLFETNLRISVDKLATLPPSKESNEPIIADMFYLHFPEDESGQAEFKLLDAWLKLHDKKIWSNRDPEGWGKFYRSCKCGVVIVHEDRLFDLMNLRPAMYKVCWSQKMNFWSIRMAEPLMLLDNRFFPEGSYCQPIFSRGGAFLITEDVFQDLRYSAMLVCWFHFHQKANPGQFKLVLFPGVLASLEKRFDEPTASPEEKEALIVVIFWIMRANSVDKAHPTFDQASLDIRYLERANNNILTFEFPGYGSIGENDDLGIPKGLTQAECNAHLLVDAFSGWTMMHSSIFKRNIVITTIKNDQLWDRWKTWGHIYTCTIKQFFDSYGVSEKQLLERVLKGDLPLPSTKSDPPSGDNSPVVNPKLWRTPSHHPDPRPS